MFELRPYHKNDHAAVYNPFREMEEMEKAFFANPFGSFFRTGALAEFRTDISDEGDSYVLQADLPGFDKKDIQLDVNGDTLIINAERHSEKETKEKDKYICSERSYGSYSRQFDISSVDADAIKAKYENGVLTLKLPKKQAAISEPRRLEIE